MTTINNQDDFLNALSDNSQWREAVRAKILGDELLQLPARFDALTDRIDLFVAEQQETNRELREANREQRETNRRLDSSVEELREANREQRETNRRLDSSVEELREIHKNTITTLNAVLSQLKTITDDVGKIKGHYARDVVVDDAAGVAFDMGLQYVSTLTQAELGEMAQRAAGRVPTNELRSFRRADLVIEATDGNDTHYIAVEVSFTADERETTRALRNARLLAEFTNHPACAAVASVRNDQSVADQVDAGEIYWHPIDENELEPD